MVRDRGGLPHDFPDRVIRDALLHGIVLRALIRQVAPGLADRMDYDHMEPVRTRYLVDDWRQRECDVPIRLPFLNEPVGRSLLVCILVEHQSTPDEAMPLRMLLTAVLFWEQEWKAWKENTLRGQPLRLTPVLPIVLHTGQETWNTSRQLSDLFEVPESWKVWLPSWPMPLWDLTEHSVAELLASGEAWWQALAVVRADQSTPAEFLEVYQKVLGRLTPLEAIAEVSWEQLVNLVLYWGIYRRPELEHQVLIDAASASVEDARLQRRIHAMTEQLQKSHEQVVYERLEAKAEAKAYRRILEKGLSQRFPEIPEAVRQRIAVADMDHLEAALEHLMSGQPLSSPEDLPLS